MSPLILNFAKETMTLLKSLLDLETYSNNSNTQVSLPNHADMQPEVLPSHEC